MNKKILLAFVGLIVLVIGVVAGIILLRNNQDIRREASTSEGTATVSLDPESGQFSVNDQFSINVYFNPENILISAVAVRLSYPVEGISPKITAGTPQISQSLLAGGEWTCPIKEVNTSSSIINIDISCINTSTTGFTSGSNVLLATIPFTAKEQTSGPISLTFDSIQSIITQKSDGSDILLTPTSSGLYSVGSSAQTSTTPTPTATPFVGGSSETSTSTPTPTPTSSASTSLASNTPTPIATAPADLPESGIALPTIIFLFVAASLLGLSIFVII